MQHETDEHLNRISFARLRIFASPSAAWGTRISAEALDKDRMIDYDLQHSLPFLISFVACRSNMLRVAEHGFLAP